MFINTVRLTANRVSFPLVIKQSSTPLYSQLRRTMATSHVPTLKHSIKEDHDEVCRGATRVLDVALTAL